jgi:Zn-dependent protease/CBS domain-containing protein
MKAQIKLGRIFGIEIGLHYSWLIIAVLIALSLSQYFAEAHPDWNGSVIWTMAIVTALLFFLSIVIHELSHAAIARRNNLPVKSITLFALGGVAEIEKEAENAKTEFWMGISGPITSAVIGLICLGISYLLGWVPMSEPNTPLMAMLVWLGYINLGLAIFNMLPGFPMDGGRVFRGIVWAITGNRIKATRIASLTGQFLALSFIILGLITFFRGSGFSGLWIAFIGWFLLNAAKATYAQEAITQQLAGLLVSDVMNQDCPVVDSRINLETFVEDNLLRTGQRCFVVVENETPVGLITSHEVKNIERKLWGFKLVTDAMKPLEHIQVVNPETPVIEALEIIGREDVNQLPVVSNGQLKGIISRDRILNYLLTKQELNL